MLFRSVCVKLVRKMYGLPCWVIAAASPPVKLGISARLVSAMLTRMRLTPLGQEIGSITPERWQRHEQHVEHIARATKLLDSTRHEGKLLSEWLRRPEVEWSDVCAMSPEVAALEVSPRAAEQVVIELKYAGYIKRQEAVIQKQGHTDLIAIPETFNFRAIPHLRAEAREKFIKVQPRNLGQAGRITGITPADIAVLMLYVK